MANMSIAKMHRRARKFVGWLAAAGVIIAYVLSFFTVIAGVVIYAIQTWSDSWLSWIVAGIIGGLFSLLIERMTLVQAAKIRNASEKRLAINAAYDAEEHKTYDVLAAQQAELKRIGSKGAWSLMIFGMLTSTAAGTLFWHYLLSVRAGLPLWQAWGFSTLFSAVVSFTLVESELHRTLQNEVIGESIHSGHFIAQAGKEDARDRAIEKFAKHQETALNAAMDDDTMRTTARQSALDTLDDAFSDGNGSVSAAINRERREKEQQAQVDLELSREALARVRARQAQQSLSNDSPNRTRRLTQNLEGDDRNTGEIQNPFRQGAQ